MRKKPAGRAKPLRVLYVDNSLGFGGAVKSLGLTLRGLTSIEKFVITSQDRDLARMWFAAQRVSSFRRLINYRNADRLANLPVHPSLRLMALKGFAFANLFTVLKNSVRLVWFVRHHEIEIIHLNNGFLPPEALLASRVTGIPCVVHLREFQRERVTSSSMRTTACVIAVSDAVAESVHRTDTKFPQVTTIHDPVDTERAATAVAARDRVRNECGISREEIAVGIFGRVIPWKGQQIFVQAMIAAMSENKVLRAVIVGDEADGHRSYFDGIKRSIREAGVEPAFVLAGYRADVEEYYAAMDIVVHSSITPEPFGMVVPEAMAARRPIIAADAGGPREVIEHGIDGFLFPPGNVKALTREILTLAADANLRARMGAAGAAKAAAKFGIASNADKVAAVYAAVLDSRSNPNS